MPLPVRARTERQERDPGSEPFTLETAAPVNRPPTKPAPSPALRGQWPLPTASSKPAGLISRATRIGLSRALLHLVCRYGYRQAKPSQAEPVGRQAMLAAGSDTTTRQPDSLAAFAGQKCATALSHAHTASKQPPGEFAGIRQLSGSLLQRPVAKTWSCGALAEVSASLCTPVLTSHLPSPFYSGRVCHAILCDAQRVDTTVAPGEQPFAECGCISDETHTARPRAADGWRPPGSTRAVEFLSPTPSVAG